MSDVKSNHKYEKLIKKCFVFFIINILLNTKHFIHITVALA